MKQAFLIILLFGFLQEVNAQNKPDVLVIGSGYDISIPTDRLVKEISVHRNIVKKTKKKLLQQCIDSTTYYNGNCFKITYYNENDFVLIEKGKPHEDYIRGEIYSLDNNEIQKINTKIKNYKTAKSDSSHVDDIAKKSDSPKVFFKTNLIFQYGGESKLTILPKINLLRVHRLNLFNPYYGVEFGIHPLMVAGAFTFSGVFGVEKDIFNLETSISHFRTTKIYLREDVYVGPFSQNSFNIKLGIQVKNIGLKVGTSFLINENIPKGQERIPLLNLGKIKGNTYGLELVIKIY